MSRVYNFSAGPAVLPEEVLKAAADEMFIQRFCKLANKWNVINKIRIEHISFYMNIEACRKLLYNATLKNIKYTH